MKIKMNISNMPVGSKMELTARIESCGLGVCANLSPTEKASNRCKFCNRSSF